MALNRLKLGKVVKKYSEKCNIPDLTSWDVSGINRLKEFFEPSKQVGKNTSDYKVVPPNYFACNLMHIGRDCVLPVAINTTKNNKYVSPAYTVFYVEDESVVLKEYLFILLNSTEKDRYFWFHCDSSVRDGMEWDSFCDLEIEVPPIHIQKKYVSVYEGLLNNLRSYEDGLEDLNLLCDIYIENLRKLNKEQLYGHLIETNEKNDKLIATKEKGVSIQKVFIDTKAKSSDISKQKIVRKGYFAFNSNTSRNSDTISIALNNDEPYAVSNTYTVFTCDKSLLPEYLFLWFKRKEFDRFARFNSWGSARETIAISDIEQAEIAIPSLEIQESIVNIFRALDKRKSFIETLKTQISSICPILVRGATLESRGGTGNV